jgi:hypothetical protein
MKATIMGGKYGQDFEWQMLHAEWQGLRGTAFLVQCSGRIDSHGMQQVDQGIEGPVLAITRSQWQSRTDYGMPECQVWMKAAHRYECLASASQRITNRKADPVMNDMDDGAGDEKEEME